MYNDCILSCIMYQYQIFLQRLHVLTFYESKLLIFRPNNQRAHLTVFTICEIRCATNAVHGSACNLSNEMIRILLDN